MAKAYDGKPLDTFEFDAPYSDNVKVVIRHDGRLDVTVSAYFSLDEHELKGSSISDPNRLKSLIARHVDGHQDLRCFEQTEDKLLVVEWITKCDNDEGTLHEAWSNNPVAAFFINCRAGDNPLAQAWNKAQGEEAEVIPIDEKYTFVFDGTAAILRGGEPWLDGQFVGSKAWIAAAYEIKRLREELAAVKKGVQK